MGDSELQIKSERGDIERGKLYSGERADETVSSFVLDRERLLLLLTDKQILGAFTGTHSPGLL